MGSNWNGNITTQDHHLKVDKKEIGVVGSSREGEKQNLFFVSYFSVRGYVEGMGTYSRELKMSWHSSSLEHLLYTSRMNGEEEGLMGH